jgi:hypothetical protein
MYLHSTTVFKREEQNEGAVKIDELHLTDEYHGRAAHSRLTPETTSTK